MDDDITQSKTYVPYRRKSPDRVNIPQDSLGGSVAELRPPMVMVQPSVGYGQQLPANAMYQMPIYVLASPIQPQQQP